MDLIDVRVRPSFFAIWVFVMASGSQALAADWRVPGDFATIQDAVNSPSVADGDRILVGPGSFAGALIDKNVTVTQNSFVNPVQGISAWRASGWEITHNDITDLRTRCGGGIGILVGDYNELQIVLSPEDLAGVNTISRNLGENRGHGARPSAFGPVD